MAKPACSRCSARNFRCVYEDFAGYKFIDQTAVAAQHVIRSRGLPTLATGATDVRQQTVYEESDAGPSKLHAASQYENAEDDQDQGQGYAASSSMKPDPDAHRSAANSALSLALLSQNKRDPFDAFHVGPISRIIEDAINYIYDRLWPLSVLSPASVGHSLCLAERSIQNPFWHHTTITQACAIWLNLHPEADESNRKEISTLRTKHMSEGLKIMGDIANGPRASDYNIVLTYGTFRMAVQPSVRSMQDPQIETFRVSPLSHIQHLNIYGSLDITQGFTETVIQRIRRNGGLAQAGSDDRMPTSRVFLFADIIVATRLDRPPLLDWPYPMEEDRVFAWTADRYAPDHEAITLALHLGQGFTFISRNFPDLQLLIDLMAEATALLDHYQRGVGTLVPGPEGWQLGRARNLAQYTLCDLKRTHEFPESLRVSIPFKYDRQMIVVEICRLSLFIYSDFVLFPLPPSTRVHGLYGLKLRLIFSNLNAIYLGCGKDAWELLTWAVTMGCLSSTGRTTREKKWWYSQLRRSLSFHGLQYGAVEGLKSILGRLLWWDVVLGPRLDVVLEEAGLLAAAQE